MEENGASALPAAIMAVKSEDETEIEETPRICPLCSSEVKLFFINFHEKLLMCENTECEFPFGYEELQFVPYKNPYNDSEITSQTGEMSLFGSQITDSGWSDIAKFNLLCESPDNQSEKSPASDKPPRKKRSKNKLSKLEKEKEMQKCVQNLRDLSMELNDLTIATRAKIKKEKWINKLLNIQDRCSSKHREPTEEKESSSEDETDSEGESNIKEEPGTSGCLSNIKIESDNSSETENEEFW